MNVLITIGGVGGLMVLLTTVAMLGRGIFKQITATEENTAALGKLTARVEQLGGQYNGHETRIAVLEDRGVR